MFRELNFYSMILRIILSLFIGGILGFNRERKNRPTVLEPIFWFASVPQLL